MNNMANCSNETISFFIIITEIISGGMTHDVNKCGPSTESSGISLDEKHAQ